MKGHKKSIRYIKKVMPSLLDKYFTETMEEAIDLMIDHSIRTPNTVDDIYHGLLDLTKGINSEKKISMKPQLEAFKELSLIGVKGYEAGRQLRSIFNGFNEYVIHTTDYQIEKAADKDFESENTFEHMCDRKGGFREGVKWILSLLKPESGSLEPLKTHWLGCTSCGTWFHPDDGSNKCPNCGTKNKR